MTKAEIMYYMERIKNGSSFAGCGVRLVYDANTDSYNGIPMSQVHQKMLDIHNPEVQKKEWKELIELLVSKFPNALYEE